MLEKEFQYYLDHQDELVKKFAGRFVVIKDQRVLGVYGSDLDAIGQTSKEHEIGTFLVHKCEPGEQNYSASYHSRVAFA